MHRRGLHPVCGAVVPVLEGVVDDGFEDDSIPDLRGSSEVKHVDGPQGGMGVAQTAGGRELQ